MSPFTRRTYLIVLVAFARGHAYNLRLPNGGPAKFFAVEHDCLAPDVVR